MKALLLKPKEIQSDMIGYLEDRMPQATRKAKVITKGTNGFCFEIIKEDAIWPCMVIRSVRDYNMQTKLGWRFWTAEPNADCWEKWDIEGAKE